jgi:hypothetical protein
LSKANYERHRLRIAFDPADFDSHATTFTGDDAKGKRLFDANCMGCHDSSVLARKDRVVQSLEEQLASCTHMANKELSASERHDRLIYLNDQFYRFR